MATRNGRRRPGLHVVLAAGLLALAAASLPAHAVITPQLVSSSVDTGYANPTILLPDHVGVGAARPFDPADPPYQTADGEIRFLLSRWGVTLCAPPASTAVITSALGTDLTGTVTVEAFKGTPNKVIRATIDPTLRPHGLTAGDSPVTVDWTAAALQPDGTCGGATAVPETFALDRQLPDVPSITQPAAVVRVTPCGLPFNPTAANCNGDTENFSLAAPQSGAITVKGVAMDPLTFPFEDQDPEKFYETSGIAAVVVRLHSCQQTGLVVFACGGQFAFQTNTFIASFSQEFACTDTNPAATAVARCPNSVSYEITIPASAMMPGATYAIDVVALDAAGYRSAVPSNRPQNSDNLAGPESDARAFLFTG